MQGIIDLRRVTSPLLERMDADIASTSRNLAASWAASSEMRQHRKFGTPADRQAASCFLSGRYAERIDPARIFLANGTQNVLLLLLSALCPKGGTVLVEEMTYRQIRDVANLLGLTLHAVALDEHGISPDALEEACRAYRPQVLYCIPTVQNPTASVMPAERRIAIAEIARAHCVTIIEDEAQGLIPLDPPAPIGAIAPDITWTVTGLSKCLMVGLRVAYVVAPAGKAPTDVLGPYEDMAFWYASGLAAALVTRMVETGIAADIRSAIQGEAAHRQSLARTILPSFLAEDRSGLHLWIKRPPLAGAILAETAAAHGVLVRSAREYALDCDAARPGIRVSLADVARDELASGLQRLAVSLSPRTVSGGEHR
jgi:DNA-binding transcriptional MocR family regulator